MSTSSSNVVAQERAVDAKLEFIHSNRITVAYWERRDEQRELLLMTPSSVRDANQYVRGQIDNGNFDPDSQVFLFHLGRYRGWYIATRSLGGVLTVRELEQFARESHRIDHPTYLHLRVLLDTVNAIDTLTESAHASMNKAVHRFLRLTDRKSYYGHLAMYVPSQDLYISFLPDGNHEFATFAENFHADVAALNGRQPDHQVSLYTLNTPLITELALDAKAKVSEPGGLRYSKKGLRMVFRSLQNDLADGKYVNGSYQIEGISNCTQFIKYLIERGLVRVNGRYEKGIHLRYLSYHSCKPIGTHFYWSLAHLLAGCLALSLWRPRAAADDMLGIDIFIGVNLFTGIALFLILLCASCCTVNREARGYGGIRSTPKGIFNHIVLDVQAAERALSVDEAYAIVETFYAENEPDSGLGEDVPLLAVASVASGAQ